MLRAVWPRSLERVAGFRSSENEVEKPRGEWKLVELISEGGKVTYKVDGKVVNEGTGAIPYSGLFCLSRKGPRFSSVTSSFDR
jgi:hypothetical protein